MDTEQIVAKASKAVAEKFAKDGAITSIFVGFNAKDPENGIGIMTPWRNEIEKRFYLMIVKEIFEREQIEFYVHVSEVWVSEVSFDKKDNVTTLERAKELAGHVVPSLDPERQEAISYVVVTPTSKVMYSQRITRADDGTGVLGPLEKKPLSIEGRMTELLPASAGATALVH